MLDAGGRESELFLGDCAGLLAISLDVVCLRLDFLGELLNVLGEGGDCEGASNVNEFAGCFREGLVVFPGDPIFVLEASSTALLVGDDTESR